MKIMKKIITCLILVGMLFASSNTIASNITKTATLDKDKIIDESALINELKTFSTNFDDEDLDKLVDLEVTVTIKEIRALDKIDLIGDPDLYVKVFINDKLFESPTWHNKKYIKANWSTEPFDVDDTVENVSIKIELWDKNLRRDKLCDLNSNVNPNYIDKREIDLIYSLRTGHWRGDDYNDPDPLRDVSGYGRANGCDDNSIYQRHRDCEIWFEITQTDYDNDGIPSWVEEEIYGTDPTVDNTGWDNDSDGVPIEWEYKWGHLYYWNWHHDAYFSYWFYNPFEWEDHATLDPDLDGLQNTEEYLTSQWESDPHRKDIFLEIDQMEKNNDYIHKFIPEQSFDLLQDAFDRRNIVFHIDDGCMGGGQKNIPFDTHTNGSERRKIYMEYFLNNDPNYWRRGVFHYAFIVYNHDPRVAGFTFRSNVSGIRLIDCFTLSTIIHETKTLHNRPIINAFRRKALTLEQQRVVLYAGVMMHETGHTLGIHRGNTPGVDNPSEHRKYHRYRSSMNYKYVYCLVDYSDGRRGRNDFDDWDRIDLTLFQIEH